MRITTQLMERRNLRMVSAEIGQEVAGRATVLTDRVGSKRGTERVYGTFEQVGQRMLKGGSA